MLIEVADAAGSPATHAFVIGVSHYPFADGPQATEAGRQFGIGNLTAATRSASEIAAWLLNEYRNPDAPLATLELFLSPSDGETIHGDVSQRMRGEPAPALREEVERAFNRFRDRCRANPANMAFVYLAGHGIQLNKRGAVVLLHDFGVKERSTLYGAIDVAGCHDAMDEAGNAHRQIWFSDACRQRPEVVKQFETLTGAFRPDERNGQVEASPLFLASSSRESAFADIGGTTIFSQALLWCLRGASAEHPDDGCPDWHVASAQLTKDLPKQVKALLADVPEQSQVDVLGRVLNVVTHRFATPPHVGLEVSLKPEDATPVPVPRLTNLGTDQDENLTPGWPVRFRGEPAIYTLSVTVEPPLTARSLTFTLEPPGLSKVMEVH